MVLRALVASLLFACLLIAGCTAAPAEKPAAAPAGGGMGESGMGGESGEGGGMVEGVVATSASALIEMGAGSRVSSDGVSVARVVAPADGWVVVNSVESPGRSLGKAWVPKGESRNVVVKLDAADGPRARVALHVDRGTKRTYEFDAERPLRSPDAQVFVDRAPVETAISLSGFGVDVLANSALVLAEDQPAGTRSVKVAYLLVPGPSWVSVIAIKDGLPAEVLGRMWRRGGRVPADRGSAGRRVVSGRSARDRPPGRRDPEPLRIRPGRPTRLGRPAVSLCGRDREQADTSDRQVGAHGQSEGRGRSPPPPESIVELLPFVRRIRPPVDFGGVEWFRRAAQGTYQPLRRLAWSNDC